jgi:subtilisin family serine protease
MQEPAHCRLISEEILVRSMRTILLAFLAGGLAITTVSAGVPASAGQADRLSIGQAGRERASPGDDSTTVTLVTGDRVLLSKGPKGYIAAPIAGPGRDGVAFGTQRRGDSTWVIPSDAVSLIASGRLDKRLFEVTALAKNGYGDDKRANVPLIVQHAKGKPVSGKPAGATVTRELASADSTVVQASKRSTVTFWTWLTGATKSVPGQRFTVRGAYANGVKRVWLDGRVSASLDRSVPQVGAPGAWQKKYTGKGVKVAVLDTGIDTTHLDLKGAVVAAKDFSASGSTTDRYGHGTHVASIITGDGARSKGAYKGVAPDAGLLNGKVLDDTGSGTESSVIAGMEWAVAQDAKVVNLSLGGWPNDGTAPMDLALNELSASSGTLFVVAAGNGGPGRYTVTTPATATEALSVAATNRNQKTADFSSAGPRIGDYSVKPEIAAPGRDIVAAHAAGAWLGDPVGDYYVKLSGTSMATPHVAGAAAILAQQQPTWNAKLLKTALMGTTRLPVNESVFRQGAGFLDVSRAVTQKVFALESSVSANLRWPHSQPVTRTITYRNPGAVPLTLALGFSPKDQNGNAAAAGVFSMPASVTVPARTTAKVMLTIDPAKSKTGLLYQGRINATATGVVVRTPLSVNIQPEAHDVTLDITDRNGNKVDDFETGQLTEIPHLIDLVKGSTIDMQIQDGNFVAHVPRGAYTIALDVLTPIGDDSVSTTLMAVPRIAVTAPVSLNLDAREGKRATAAVEAPNAKATMVGTTLLQLIGDEVWGTQTQLTATRREPEAYVIGTPSASRPFQFTMFQTLLASGRTYELAFGESGKLPDNPLYPVADSELADLTLVFGTHGVKANGQFNRVAFTQMGSFSSGSTYQIPVTMPSTRRHLVSTTVLGSPVLRHSDLWAFTPAGQFAYNEVVGGDKQYEAGRTYTETLTSAAFTPQGTGMATDDGVLSVELGPFNSASDSFIFQDGTTLKGDLVLKRNGTEVARTDDPYRISTKLGPDGSTYTAIMHASRQVPWSNYVPKVSGTWTFKPFHPADWTFVPIVSTAVQGDFDGWGRAPAGKAFPLTLDVDDAFVGVKTATVRVSYDDGKTWTSVPVSNATGEWIATVTHPNVTSAYVSLRVVVTDTRGNSGGWTATRAYKIAQLG